LQADDKLKKKITIAKREIGRCGLSVYGEDGVGPAVLISTLKRGDPPRLPHTRVQLCTAGAIRQGGFEIVPTLEAPHQTIVLPDDFERTDILSDLIDLFQPPVYISDLDAVGYPDHSSWA
jgi:hypothetical protein